eukprot:gb/GECG01014819.1/.p1 GENE.gb/GECG01014819.1/~~gb/GECG01014819.1/.p1  ORF type:complete len:292 (+),score=20.05 gb/GECG01014819.1/:1-876(+)
MGCTESSLHPETDPSRNTAENGRSRQNKKQQGSNSVVESSSPLKTFEPDEKPILLRLTKVEERLMQVVDDVYGQPAIQVGYTDGHMCISDKDKTEATSNNSSLLYGEILAPGVTKLMNPFHLDAKHATVLVDLGCGLGKLLLQSFLQFPNLKKCVGVELAYSRAIIACEAGRNLARNMPKHFRIEQYLPGVMVRVRSISSKFGKNRILEFRRGNMWSCNCVKEADSIVLHTELTKESIRNFKELLSNMKIGCRFVTVSVHYEHTCKLQCLKVKGSLYFCRTVSEHQFMLRR